MLVAFILRSKLMPMQKAAFMVLTKRCASIKSRCDAHMNELPIPCGPWHDYYKNRQSFYNKWLVFGVLWWCFSLSMMISTGSIYLNWGPPLQPGPPSDMVDECEDE